MHAIGRDLELAEGFVEGFLNVRDVRLKMGLSQSQFATKFGFPPATLRNWEQGRSYPDAPTRVLLAVIAKHPEAVEDVLRKEIGRAHV